jgi:hypothetical protein
LIIDLSTSDNLTDIAIGQSVTINVNLSGVLPGDELNFLGGRSRMIHHGLVCRRLTLARSFRIPSMILSILELLKRQVLPTLTS